MISAVLPVKSLAFAKQRLATLLSPVERRLLFSAMLEDVLCCLNATSGVDRVLVVTDDAVVASLARRYGAQVLAERQLAAQELGSDLKDEQKGLNRAVSLAAAWIEAKSGAEQGMLVVHGDLPFIDAEQLDAVLSLHADRTRAGAAVTLVPDRQGKGTNVLVCSPANCIAFKYGESSCQLHRQQALQRDVDFALLQVADIGFDVDTEQDLLDLLISLNEHGTDSAQHTRNYVARSGLSARLDLVEVVGGQLTTVNNEEVSTRTGIALKEQYL